MSDFDLGFVYVASPYSDPEPKVMQTRYEWVASYVAKCLHRGHIVYSPIVHHHRIALEYKLPSDWESWRLIDGNMLCAAREMEVLCLEGWRRSIGVQTEIGIAMARGLTITFLTPDGKKKETEL